jgi:4'-phosphopantetheinyl transferase
MHTWRSCPDDFEIATGKLHIWRIALDVPLTLLSALGAELSEAEQKQAERFRTDLLRQRYTAAHAALRRILAQYVHQPAAKLQFKLGEYGKPHLISENGFTFNLSHSNAWALCAVSRQQPVGVDIEWMKPLPDLELVAKRFFSRREQQAFATLPEADKPRGFFQCWTRKEAFIKALGTGLTHPLDSFDVTLRPDEEAKMLEIRSATAESWSLAHLEPAEGYVGAVVLRGELADIKYFNFEPTTP